MRRGLGFIYIGLTAATILFQVALILGAPLGSFTQGGAQTGALDSVGRVSATASILILVLLAFVVALKSEVLKSQLSPKLLGVGFWVVLFVNSLEFILNWITTSAAERLLWGPVNTVLFGCVVGIAFLGRRK